MSGFFHSIPSIAIALLCVAPLRAQPVPMRMPGSTHIFPAGGKRGTSVAERVEIPVTINGQICGERDADYFRLTPHTGDVVVCEVLAARLGSPLDPLLEVLDALGRPVKVVQRRLGSDVAVAFMAVASQEY